MLMFFRLREAFVLVVPFVSGGEEEIGELKKNNRAMRQLAWIGLERTDAIMQTLTSITNHLPPQRIPHFAA
jgi:hypothetical protein